MKTRQDPNKPIIQYVHILKVASKCCKFEKLGSKRHDYRGVINLSQITRRLAGHITQTQKYFRVY